jgi:hypothetical protein
MITATANSGYTFTNWNDGSTSATRTVTVPSGGATYTATFATSSNDNFANAQPLSGNSGSVSDNNVGATTEAGEPSIAGVTTGASVWFSWTAPASGQATFDTFGSSFDTVLGVYTGNSVFALTPVASNDDYGSGYQSRASFAATSGVTYMIAVAGYRGASGAIVLNWTESSSSSYTVTVIAGFGGTVRGGGSYASGETATVSASPARRYRFNYWTDENGAVVSYSQTYSFSVTGNTTLTANFRRTLRK